MRALHISDRPEIEHLDGVPYPKMSPKTEHALVAGKFILILAECGAEANGVFGPEWRFNLGRIDRSVTDFVPDVAFVSHGRLEKLTGADHEGPPFAPDIAFEVRSPGENAAFRNRKIERYVKCGSMLVFDVDPETETAIVHSKDGEQHFKSGDAFANNSLPWLTFEIARLFSSRK